MLQSLIKFLALRLVFVKGRTRILRAFFTNQMDTATPAVPIHPPTGGKAPKPMVSQVGTKAPVAAGKALPAGGKAPVTGGKAPLPAGGKAPALGGKAPVGGKATKAGKASKKAGKGKEGKGKGKSQKSERSGDKKAPVSQSLRAGLLFPVGRIHRLLKQGLLQGQRVGSTAAIFQAAAIEYLVSDILEQAGVCAKELKVKRINPRHILFAVRTDEELDALMKADICGGGVMPHIHKALISKKKNKKKLRGKRGRSPDASGAPAVGDE